MSALYRIDSSIQGEKSVTREMLDTFDMQWNADNPGSAVIRRDLLTTPVSPATWVDAVATHVPADPTVPPTVDQLAAKALAAELADEMLAADAIVIGAPLYNWGPAPHILCWIDMLWTDPRFAPRTFPLRGKPVVLITAQGGDGAVDGPRGGWNHSLPHLELTFGSVFGGDVTVIDTPLTLAEHSPHLEQFIDQARDVRRQSRARAREVASSISGQLAA